MPDSVPAWVLIANTVANGAFLFGGALLSPWFSDRAQKRQAKRETDAILREKAEAIFMAIGDARREAVARTVHAMKLLGPTSPSEDAPLFSNFETIRALVAMYFPSALPILDELDAEMEKFRSGRSKDLFAAVDREPESKKVAAYKGIHVIITSEGQTLTHRFLDKLQVHLTEAVRHHFPS